ncbi:MAG: HIT family protein [Deltaproteobacteria bacterium]|nr:HIT family protein [Deltaproteobacteria bacterium]MCK5682237.1 HIT family protein [bacterium]
MSVDICPFCNLPAELILFENSLTFAVLDKFPASPGHLLVIPFRHVASYWELHEDEVRAVNDLLKQCKLYVDEKFSPHGYNIGVNVGKPAGQTVMHVHVHLIPRYKGDVEDPVGGVRNTIPGKGNYLS